MTPKESVKHLAGIAERAAARHDRAHVEIFRAALAQAPDRLAVVRLRLSELEQLPATADTTRVANAALELYEAVSQAAQAVLVLAAQCPGLALLDRAVSGERLGNGEEVN